MITLEKQIFNPFQENTFIVWDDKTKDSMIVDPGCSSSEEEYVLSRFVENKNLNIKYLVNTHCHIDHVLGNSFVTEKYQCEFFAPELDIPLLNNVVDQGKMFGLELNPSPPPDNFITEELMLYLGDEEINFLFTPGHTSGEYCILFEKSNICITGDVLFREGVGRTDLWGGDYDTLLRSIEEKLFTLNDGIVLYPGHGNSTTIGHEKLHNPFLK